MSVPEHGGRWGQRGGGSILLERDTAQSRKGVWWRCPRSLFPPRRPSAVPWGKQFLRDNTLNTEMAIERESKCRMTPKAFFQSAFPLSTLDEATKLK